MKRTLVVVAIATALMGASSAYAITDSETNASIPFNLSAPGARSMGMGGAFLGLADDATAAYTNPAGLTQLVTPEVSAEARHTNYSIPYANGGTATIGPFNASGVNSSDSDSSTSNLSFLSFVLPHDRWSFAVYRDELVHFDGDFTSDGTVLGDKFETFPVAAHSNLKIINYGATAAYKATDNVSLGIGLSYYDFKINTSIMRSEFAGNADNIPAGTALNQQVQNGSDNAAAVNLGARFVLSEHLSAGLVYRQGPKFDYRASNTVVFTDPPTVTEDLSNVKFKVPDEFGGGLSWHPNDSLVVNFDADFIQYSQLTHGIQSLFGNDPAVVSRLTIPNGVEYHLGGEYTFTQMTHPFSLRAGVWHDPRHSIEYKGADPGVDDVGQLGLATLFSVGKGSQTHYSIGGGFAFAKFQIDAAADFSDLTDIYSISAVYHF